LILCLDQRFQVGEWLVRSRCWARGAGQLGISALLGKEALMLILVAVCAQQLPVPAIGRVVVVVLIAMMDLEQLASWRA
jgi:hypothetical protein